MSKKDLFKFMVLIILSCYNWILSYNDFTYSLITLGCYTIGLWLLTVIIYSEKQNK